MTANLFIASYEVGLDGFHAYLIFDNNTDNDNDFETGLVDVRILRGGYGPTNYGVAELSVLVERRDAVGESADWTEAQEATNVTPIAASWAAMWNFAATMGDASDPLPGLYDTDILYSLAGPNSNSVINTVLNIAGINFRDVMPTGNAPSNYPGHMGLLDGSGNSTYTAFIYNDEAMVFHKRGGADKINLEWNSATDEHGHIQILNDNNSTGLTTIYFDGLDYADVEFFGTENLIVQYGTDLLAVMIDYHEDRANDLAEGAQTTAFEFEDLYYRLGSAGDNILSAVGISKDARLEGGDGNDLLRLGTGASNYVDGGAGFDRVDYTSSGSDPITIQWVSETEATDGRGGTLLNIESFTLSGGSDTVFINPDREATYHGRGGFNTVDYSALEDASAITITDHLAGYLTDNFGNTFWNFGTISTTDSQSYSITYTGVRDVSISTGAGDDTITGGAGDDEINGGGGNDILYGGDGDDSLVDNYGTNTVYGGAGNDYLYGSGTFYGGDGDDKFGNKAGTLYGGSGSDLYLLLENTATEVYDDSGTVFFLPTDFYYETRLDISEANDGFLVRLMKEDNNGIFVQKGTIILNTPSLDNWDFISSTPYDPSEYYGTSGDDTVDMSSAGLDKTANLYAGNDSYEGSSHRDYVYGGTGNDTIYGAGDVDFLYGQDGNDALHGEGGDDFLYASSGNDTLMGGSGNDTYYLGRYAFSTLSDTSGTNVIILDDIESSDVVFQTIDDVLKIYDKTVTNGHQIAQVETPDDFSSISFADGVVISIGDALELADYTTKATGSADSLDFSNYGFGITIDLLGGSDSIIGSAYNDVLNGGEGDDVINGHQGSGDILNGGSGNDTIEGTGQLTGGDGNDALYGSGLLHGNDGNDTLIGSGTLYGDAGNDTLTSTGGVSVLYGGSGDDTLSLSAGSGIHDAGSGNDLIRVGAGTHTVTAGSGNDRVVIQSTAENVTVTDLFDSGDRLDLTAFHSIRSISDLVLTDGTDELIVTAADANIDFSITLEYWSTESSPYLNFRFYGAPDAYEDAFSIASGQAATLDVLANDEETNGNPLYIDSLVLDPAYALGSWSINSNATIAYAPRAGFTGREYFEYVVINDEDYTDRTVASVTVLNPGGQFIENFLDQSVAGGTGDDFVYGYATGASVSGADGNDLIGLVSGNGSADGGAGSDYIELFGWNGNGVSVNLSTGQGYEIGFSSDVTSITNIENIMGSQADDVLTGNSGNNILVGNQGSDTLDGGGGTDTVDYRNFLAYNSGAISVNLASGTAFDATDASTDTLTSVENVIGGVAGDTILGNTGVNVLQGMEGNDILEGGAGNDTLDGGDGEDTVRYSAAASGVTVNLTNGTVTGGDGSDTLVSIENVIGSAYADTIYGNNTVNRIESLAGNDTIYSYAANDLIYAGDGDDFVSSAKGTDTIYGGAGNDRLFGDVSGESDAGGDFLYGEDGDDELYGADGDDTLEGGAGVDLLEGGNGADTLRGGDGVDTLKGQAGADTLYGDGGNDILYGDDGYTTGGADVLYGGAGADTLDGRIGNDTLYGGDDADSIKGSLGDDILYGDGGNDTLYGDDDLTTVGHDTLYGGDGNDTLYGRAGNDVLNGNAGVDSVQGQDGNDILWAGEGADNLYGGSGSNTFALYNKAGNDNDLALVQDWGTGSNNVIDIADLLTDYEAGVDTLSDFVNVTVGTHTTISVDRDGTGTSYGWDDVLRLQNISSFETNEDTLVTNGTLLVA